MSLMWVKLILWKNQEFINFEISSESESLAFFFLSIITFVII